jgi:hypothetical protein
MGGMDTGRSLVVFKALQKLLSDYRLKFDLRLFLMLPEPPRRYASNKKKHGKVNLSRPIGFLSLYVYGILDKGLWLTVTPEAYSI